MMKLIGMEGFRRTNGVGIFFWSLVMVFMTEGTFGMGAVDLENLALYRPVTASSVGHYPVAAVFAVDGESDTGWRSTRATDDGGDWLAVDLQALCRIDAVRLVWSSRADRPVFEEIRTSDLFGGEQVAAYGLTYSVQLSSDGQAWKTVYATTEGAGGVEIVSMAPAEARFVRVVVLKRSHPKCGVGINELAVLGSCDSARPQGDSWKLRRKAKVQPVPAKAAAKDWSFNLDSGWELMREDWANLTAEEIMDAGLDTSAWYNATVPGTVLGTLVEQEVFPEPTIGMNCLKIPEALSRHVWWYRTELTVPNQWAQNGQRLWLEFDGINYCAEVWLNTHRLGQINGAFTRGTFDITDVLNKTGKNILAVRILPPPHPGIPLEKSDANWLYNGGALGKDSPTFVASIGWDWMAPVRDRGIGIWSDVRVRRTGGVVIGDPHVVTDLPLPDTSPADISITVPVRNESKQPQEVVVRAAFEGVAVSKTLSVPAGGEVVAAFTPAGYPELRLKHPKLWWPVGYGEQPLYDLALSAAVDGVVSDTYAMRFGVRELSYRGSELFPRKMDTIDFSPVQARYVRLNCLDRGTRFGFSLFTFSVFDKRRPESDLAEGAAITASSIESEEHPAGHANDNDSETRWASKMSEPQWICVDLGSVQTVDQVRLLWEAAYAKHFIVQVSNDGQDWTDVRDCTVDTSEPRELEISVNGHRVLCRGGNWGYPEILLRLTDERMEAAVRLHHEANLNMIRNWVGQSTTQKFYDLCDEYGILIWNDFWLANPGDGPNPDNPELFLANVRDTVLHYRNHPSIALWCGRNEGMPPEGLDEGMRQLTTELDGTRFYQSHSSSVGVNGGGPYKYMPPKRYFEDLNHGFKTEIGMPSVPSAESIRKMLDDVNPWPIDGRWAYHDFAPQGNQYRDEYTKALETKFGTATNLDDYCRKAQMINYDGYRAIFEGCNHKIWNDCSGVLLWMSHPAWPSMVWQVYDYWYGTDGSFFGSKKANEPVHIQYCPATNMVELINHTAKPVEGTISAMVLGLDASVLWRKSVDVTAAIDEKTDGFKIEWPERLPAAYLVKLKWSDAQGGLLSENMYWLGDKDSDLQALSAMPTVTLAGNISFVSGKDGEAAQVTLTNDSKNVALMTHVMLRDAKTGERILPAYYSDNYLSFLPGESKTVTICCAAKDAGEKMKVTFDGWNVEPAELR